MTYSPTLEDHLLRPRNVGVLADATGVGRAVNEGCGDRLHLYLRLEEGRIVAARFQAQGCAPAMAAGSLLTELLVGLTAEEAREITPKDIESALGGLPKAKRHAAVLARDAVLAALGNR